MGQGKSRLKAFHEIDSELKIEALFSKAKNSWEIEIRCESGLLEPAFPAASLEPTFKEGLWEQTCLEVFEFDEKSQRYVEWNFSPSGDWACFVFTDYRQRDAKAMRLEPLTWSWSKDNKVRTLTMELPVAFKTSKLQFTAVIDWGAKGLDYYALKHQSAKPDFHTRLKA
jgi:hypothetical protein